jgi:adenylate cyclase
MGDQVTTPPRKSDGPFFVADWEVQPGSLRISRNDQTVKLEPKTMELLVYLADRPGEAVTREELEAQVWAGMVVSYDSLTGAVQKLRKAFDDDSRNPRIIETISKTGYRLIAPVTEAEASEHSPAPFVRRLAAILAADIVGYSRLIEQDETGTVARIKTLRDDLIDPAVTRHMGQIVRLAGDGALVEFPSVVEATQCAIDLQREMLVRNADAPEHERIVFRIGVNLGDIIVEEDNLHGEGINVAARLEALAEPGGILVSEQVVQQVEGKIDAGLTFVEERTVKNIERPVRIYRVDLDGEPRTASASGRGATAIVRPRGRVGLKSPIFIGASAVALLVGVAIVAWLEFGKPTEQPPPAAQLPAIDEEPSIAVLPFQNLSDDKEQQYFSDGITNDTITDLSKFSNLFVIAATSVFKYKNSEKGIKEIGQELGVRYVLEGSVQRSAGMVRINAQLIDATTDYHLWAERYDRELKDIFAVQDEITQSIVTALRVKLVEGEQQRVALRYTDVIEAYDLLLRGRTYLRGTRKTHLKARGLFDQAIKLDPEFAAAHAEKSVTYFSNFIMPMSTDKKVLGKALKTAERAVELDDALPLAYARLGWALLANKRHDDAIEAAQRAVALDPNDAESNAQLGNILNWAGEPEEGIPYIEKAMRLNPHHSFSYLFYLGHAYYLLKEHEKAVALLNRVVTRAPNFVPAYRHLAVLYWELGRKQDAQAAVKKTLQVFPAASIEDSRNRCLYRGNLLGRFFKGLRRAGMPEGRPGEEPMAM